MSEETTKTQAPDEAKPPMLPDVLRQMSGAPSQAEIDGWKDKHGDVFVSGFSEQEMYVWRGLSRVEYRELQMKLADPQNQWDQWKYEEAICEKCVLWPKTGPDYWVGGKAGTPSALADWVMAQSNFLSPQVASLLVAKL